MIDVGEISEHSEHSLDSTPDLSANVSSVFPTQKELLIRDDSTNVLNKGMFSK